MHLGIDLGTSSVKVCLMDDQGQLGPVVRRDYPVDSPAPGAAESDPEQWWEATRSAVRELMAGSREKPRSVGLSGQMHGVVLTHQDGSAVRPAILWADSRSGQTLDRFRSLSETMLARLANPLVAGMTGPSLLWLGCHDPDAVGAARWALQPKDWLRARLTGDFASEPTDASATLLWDTSLDAWDLGVVTALGIPPDLLAPVRESLTPAGYLSGVAAAALGLEPGLPVAHGSGDCAAALLGAGLNDPGTAQLTLGTGGQMIRVMADGEQSSPTTHYYRAAPSGSWYAMAAALNVGLALQWVTQILGVTWSDLYATAMKTSRSDGPYFLPHLSGERTPYLTSQMRGAWTNLDLSVDRETMMHAALEGVAFSVRDAAEQLAGETEPTIRLAGGGSTSPEWRQMLCDVLGRPLAPVEAADASVRGAALSGAIATGSLTTADAFGALAPVAREATSPTPAARHYEERFATYRELARESARSAAPGPTD